MATIGLDKLYYAKITEGDNGDETYGTPTQLAKAMTAELSVELAEATLYADDGAAEVVKEFQSGTLTLGIDDIGVQVAQDLTGAKIDDNKVLISASEDGGEPVAIGFRAKKSNGKYRYFWLYKVKFGIPATNLTTMRTAIPSHINMDTTLSGLSDVGRAFSGQAFNVTIPLTIDGTTLARILAEIQWTQNAAYVRNLGMA